MSSREYEFGDFRVNPQRYELTRAGHCVRLEKIPFDLLVLLLERREELLSREDITAVLWGTSPLQDLDQSLNTAIRKIRVALRDSVEDPHFLQTVVGRGYRFIAPVKVIEREAATEPATPGGPRVALATPRMSYRWRLILAAISVMLVAAGWFALSPSLSESRNAVLVAVLPFEDLNRDPERLYFSRGVTEEIITQMGRTASAGFGVIAGPSVWRYRGAQPTPSQVAGDLGAQYVLMGSVEHEGPTLRITARLIRARDGLQVWTDSFDGPRDAVLPLQQDVAVSVARAVQSQLGGTLGKTSMRRPPMDGEAVDLYFRGRFYWNQRTEVSLKQAIDYFHQSLARAPGYAPAYAALADCYAALVYGCYLAPAEGFPQARAALQQARQLDPEAPEVFASEGYMNMYFDWDFNAAARNLERAIAANPNYAPAYDWLGVLFTATGKSSAALVAFEHARRLDPASLPILTNLGFHFHYSGRNKDAEEKLRQVFLRDPNFPLAHFWMGRVMSAEGNCEGTLAEFGAASASLHEWQPLIAAHGYAAGVCGQSLQARQDLQRLQNFAKSRFVTSYGMALIYAGIDDKEQALIWLRKAVEERSHWLVWIRLDPRLRSLRADARFQALVSKVFPGG